MLKSVFFMNLILTCISMKLGFFNYSPKDDANNEMDGLGVGAMMPHDLNQTIRHDSTDIYGI